MKNHFLIIVSLLAISLVGVGVVFVISRINEKHVFWIATDDIASARKAITAGNTSLAERDIKHAIRLEPSYYYYHDVLGRLYAKEGRYSEAAAEYDREVYLSPSMAGDPATVSRYISIGRSMLKHGEAGQAKAALLRARSLAGASVNQGTRALLPTIDALITDCG